MALQLNDLRRPEHVRRHLSTDLHRQRRQTVSATSAPFAYDVTAPALTAAATTGDRVSQLS